MKQLALMGGIPIRTKYFPPYNVIGEDEKRAVMAVMDTGVLSKYIGAWHEDFLGGPQVRAFEEEWGAMFGAGHAIAVNSATSGLYAAMGAAGVSPGDEVIVPPLSMSASATAAVIWGGVPVFCDVDPENFSPLPKSVIQCITPQTKAIMVVHLLGHPVDMDPIMAVARERGIVVIEDCAQAIHAEYNGRPVGTLGDIGVFSLNYHKHIHTGEGGVCVTNNADLAEKMQYIRNHAEAVAAGKKPSNLVNLVGFNFRMGEIEAAIGRSLLPKSKNLIKQRRENVVYLEKQIGNLQGLPFAKTKPNCIHSYYAHALHCHKGEHGVGRDLMVKALRAELPMTEMREEAKGALLGPGYVTPLYQLPMFQNKIAFGDQGYPFKGAYITREIDYSDGICPNAEHASRTMLTHEMMRPGMTHNDLDDVAAAFHKVFDNLAALAEAQSDG